MQIPFLVQTRGYAYVLARNQVRNYGRETGKSTLRQLQHIEETTLAVGICLAPLPIKTWMSTAQPTTSIPLYSP